MSAIEKTIRMPKPMLEGWLRDLRSGSFIQAEDALQNCNGFCCLGVLQMGVDGKVEKDRFDAAYSLPSMAWLQEKGITFLSRDGHKLQAPFLPQMNETADAANDRGQSFLKIADAIEAAAEGY